MFQLILIHRCTKCDTELPYFNFRLTKRGIHSYCNVCNNIINKQRYHEKYNNSPYLQAYYKRREERRVVYGIKAHDKIKETPQYKLINNLRVRFRETVSLEHRVPPVIKLLGVNDLEFLLYIESLFKEEMSWDNYGGNGEGKYWVLDHIKPICAFNQADLEQRRICWYYTNLQPMWIAEHREKAKEDRLAAISA